MQIYSVTLAGNTTPVPIVPQDSVVQRNVPFQTLIIGSTAHVAYVGDSKVSNTNGVPIPASGLPLVIPVGYALTQNLNGCFLCGTSSDVVIVMVIE